MAKINTTRQANKKDIIQKKACVLFRQKGYNATTMRGLAEALGIEAASLYNHISGKQELLQSICFEVADAYFTHIAMVETTTTNQLDKVESIIRFHIKMMMQKKEAVYVSNRDWKHLQEPHLTQFLQKRKLYEKRFAAIVQAGIAKKEIKPLHPYSAVLTILSATRSIEFWQKNKQQITATQIEKDVVALLISGLKK